MRLKRISVLLAMVLLFWSGTNKPAHAQYNGASLATAFLSVSSTTSTQIQKAPTGQNNYGRHYIQIQNGPESAANVWLCLNTQNTCTQAKAFVTLVPGQPWIVPVGMYTGISSQQLGNSIIFGGDLSMLATGGGVNVYVLID